MQDGSWPRDLSRRDFLVGTAGLWISASLPRPLAAEAARLDATPSVLSAAEWKCVEAMTMRILPTDETPGAREAGCVNFIDKALANEDAAALANYRSALAEIDRIAAARGHATFSQMSPSEQDALLQAIEEDRVVEWRASAGSASGFFATVRMHTILGFVLDPSHGGNRDYVGWKVMGWPGPVHHLGGATPRQMLGEERFVPIWERKHRAHSKS